MAVSEKITHEKIINAVLSSAFVKSNGATSLVDIADKLGIKKASLYNHYSSKEAMIADTIKYCGDYLRKTTFIPNDMPSVAQKYPVETVLKGIANRWIKINEKDPLLQIYTFVESEKYFTTPAAQIMEETRNRLKEQTVYVMSCLSQAGKIKQMNTKDLELYAGLFVSIVREMVDSYIVSKKMNIRLNPETGDGTLFDIPSSTEHNIEETDLLIERFCAVLK